MGRLHYGCKSKTTCTINSQCIFSVYFWPFFGEKPHPTQTSSHKCNLVSFSRNQEDLKQRVIKLRKVYPLLFVDLKFSTKAKLGTEEAKTTIMCGNIGNFQRSEVRANGCGRKWMRKRLPCLKGGCMSNVCDMHTVVFRALQVMQNILSQLGKAAIMRHLLYGVRQ